MKKLIFLCTIITLLASPLHAQQPSSGGTSYWGLFGALSLGAAVSSFVWYSLYSSFRDENRKLTQYDSKILKLEEKKRKDEQTILEYKKIQKKLCAKYTAEQHVQFWEDVVQDEQLQDLQRKQAARRLDWQPEN